MTQHTPRLTIGLPVYNGEEYLSESLDALLGQTYEDFELVISSNASDDATDDICRAYAERDPRVRVHRQTSNVGAAPNHNAVLDLARGELFKWASGDDLYARDLVERCVNALDEHSEAVLAHSWTAAVDGSGQLIQAYPYPLATSAPNAPERLRSLLFDGGDIPGAIRADDFYGVIRTDVLKRIKRLDSYFHSDRTFMAELALWGPFVQVPDWLYFRRHHDSRASSSSIRRWCGNNDPRRRDRWRHPTARLVGEYLWAHYAMIRRAPLDGHDRRVCYAIVTKWLVDRLHGRLTSPRPTTDEATPFVASRARSPQVVVAGQDPSP